MLRLLLAAFAAFAAADIINFGPSSYYFMYFDTLYGSGSNAASGSNIRLQGERICAVDGRYGSNFFFFQWLARIEQSCLG